MTLEETLIKYGLDQKEAKIYLASLELGPSSVAKIAQKAEIKRPTTYLVLEELIKNGLVAKSIKVGKVVFTAEKPEALIRILKSREAILSQAMPMLKAVMQVSKKRPKISIYEGEKGIRQVYQEIFGSDEIWWFGSVKDVNKIFSEITSEMTKISKRRKIKVRDLLTDTSEDREYAKGAVSAQYEIRLMSRGVRAPIDLGIFGNKVAVFSVTEELFVVVIESPEVALSFRSFYELAWQSAKFFKK